jgi:ferrous iron transport protein B
MQPSATRTDSAAESSVVLVGNPNVGKSVIFGALTGRYVAVSNFPGTTVEVARGAIGGNGSSRPLVDTPGIQSLLATSDDERVTRDILRSERDATVVLVVDTKNLLRGLMLALELAETGVRFVIDLNMADEARARGIGVDAGRLSELLGVPVVSTVALRGEGIDRLRSALARATRSPVRATYAQVLEDAIDRATAHLENGVLDRRGLAVMALGDPDLAESLASGPEDREAIARIRNELEGGLPGSMPGLVHRYRLEKARGILDEVHTRAARKDTPAERLGRFLVHPVFGWPVLAAVLYVLYLAVGVLGAGVLVDLLEGRLFGEIVNPWVTVVADRFIPVPLVRDFLVGEYGAITMGLSYALAIVLPIVAIFFLAFSVLEDSGYLPRLAVMLDRMFRWMGLNGKAVLPMILGLGCDTMATMTTRILDTRKERIQVTLLLALGVPCSAQLGVILGMVAVLGAAAISIWTGVVAATLLTVGWLAARLIPGERSDFILELPPIRTPGLRNIVLKTVARVEWYLREVVPVFLAGTAALFVLDRLRLLQGIERAMQPLVQGWLGLPVETSGAFLVGFLRRDYGAAGLFAVARDGLLDPIQITVSLVVITLFMPCFANFLMIVREHGTRTALLVTAVVFPMAFLIGGLLLRVLRLFPGIVN